MTQTLSKNVIADFSTQLAVKMAVGATTGTLASATDSDGVALPTGTYFLTLDKNNSKKEYIKCTLTGTALTSIQSISRQGVLTSGTAREHRVGANVIISDFASLLKMNDVLTGVTNFDSATPLGYDGAPTISTGNQFATKTYVDDSTVGISGNETVAGIKTFSSSPIVPAPTTDLQAATKKYADDLAIAGSPDASTTVKGIVEQATNAEIVAGTTAGATGAQLFVNPGDVATTGVSKVLLTGINGMVSSTVIVPQTINISSSIMTANVFMDSEATIGSSGTTIYLEYAGKPRQVRNLTTDWASADGINSQVLLGSYLYVFVRDASSNFRVYRYLKSDITSSPTLMTIATQAFATTGGSATMMTSNGTDFFFNNKAGNSANNYIASKYTLSDTTLTYSSDITCGSVAASLYYFLVDASVNVYGFAASTDSKIRKFNSSGTLQSTTDAYNGNRNGLLNYNNIGAYIGKADGTSDYGLYYKIYLA